MNTVGTSHIAPNTLYPPAAHPRAYALDWEHGRVLHDVQVIYISQGEGLLETRNARWDIRAGDAFMLHPEVWHRYRPDIHSGWQESWVGFSGPVAHQLVKQHFPLSRPRFRLRDERPLAAEFLALKQLASENKPSLHQVLAGRTMTILGMLFSSSRPDAPRTDKEAEIVQAAITALSGLSAEDVDLEKLAKSLNVSYSSFRRSFKERSGLSPNQYRLHVKLSHARDLLRSTSLSIKEVCERSGFHSEAYFCRLFKGQVGCTPGEFRNSGAKSFRASSPKEVQ